MMDLPVHPIPIIGAAAEAFCIGYRVRRTARSGKTGTAPQASIALRSKILAELEGLYPLPRSWSRDVYNKFNETIPGIESAAAEFRNFVPYEKRRFFDETLKHYCEHCSTITWQSCATFGVIPGKSKPDEIRPKEILRQNVNAVLSFAKAS